MNKTDQMLLDRVARGPVSFTHGVDVRGRHTKLVRSTISPSQQKHLHRLAVMGLLSEKVEGCGGHGSPPETVVTYALTAMGRAEQGIRAPTPVPHNRWTPPTDAELEVEGIE